MDGFSDAVSITAVSTKHKSDEHLLLLHRRICCKSGHLTKQKEPRLEIALVFLLCMVKINRFRYILLQEKFFNLSKNSDMDL